jgi:hypothetical protein
MGVKREREGESEEEKRRQNETNNKDTRIEGYLMSVDMD